LDFCGFHKYVNRVETTDEKRNLYRNITQRVVKIRRERSVSTSTKRERSGQILELLREFTHYDAEEIEVFKDRVLPEVLNNVMEHGVNNLDKGWYSLAQYHPNTGIISLCLADNGVGISNSLLNGPLGLDLRVRHPIKSGNDGDMIQIALKERISGAWTARRKGLALLGNNPKGEARGNGLTRIVKTCRELDIKFTLVSNRGAILIDGTKENVYNSDIKLFAGTLYHFVIPAKKIER